MGQHAHERIVLTRRGTPVAAVISIEDLRAEFGLARS
jgi:prevent-host-death family protein